MLRQLLLLSSTYKGSYHTLVPVEEPLRKVKVNLTKYVATEAGLRELARPAHSGLRALMQLAQLDPAKGPFNTQDIGFRLAPRGNSV